jgi:hypothetical protein
MSGPIALSDAQLSAVMTAAEPLAPSDRAAFLEHVATLLRDIEVGDGAVHRAIATAQRAHFHPEADPPRHQGRWGR